MIWATRVNANLDALDYEGRRDALAALGVSVAIWKPGSLDANGAAFDRWQVTMQPIGSDAPIVFRSTSRPLFAATSFSLR